MTLWTALLVLSLISVSSFFEVVAHLSSSVSFETTSQGSLNISARSTTAPIYVNGIDIFHVLRPICMNTPCPSGYYRSGCNELSDIECRPCLTCGEREYRLNCGFTNPGTCHNATACDKDSEYESQPPTTTSDSRCSRFVSCSSDEYESSPGTKTTDRKCASLTICEMDSYEIVEPTATNDRICSPCLLCEHGFYRANCSGQQEGVCAICEPCPDGNKRINCHGTSPGTCVPCVNALPIPLDCDDTFSQMAVGSEPICEVTFVENCCCEEFYSLNSVNGNILIGSNQTIVSFGTIRHIGGNITVAHSNTRGNIQSVDFLHVTQVEGNINLSYQRIHTLNFGLLGRINGSLDLSGNMLQHLDFKQISLVGGFVRLFSNGLTRVSFPSLTAIHGDMLFHSNLLAYVDFGPLAQVGGNIRFDNNAVLTSVNFRSLAHVRENLLLGNNKLTSIDFRSITQVDGFINLQNNNLTDISFTTLTIVGGNLNLQSNALSMINFGAMNIIKGGLRLENNNLTEIHFNYLTEIGGWLRVFNNPSLKNIDCTGLGACICHSSLTRTQNCKLKCNAPECY